MESHNNCIHQTARSGEALKRQIWEVRWGCRSIRYRMKKLIEKFIMRNSQMVISEDDEFSGEGSDPKTIYLIGNVESFQSIMHIMSVSLNMLEDKINMSRLPFIQNKLKKQFLINIDYENGDTHIGPLIDSGDKITWYLNGVTAGIVATTIHGLGYAYKTYDFFTHDNESTHVINCLLI